MKSVPLSSSKNKLWQHADLARRSAFLDAAPKLMGSTFLKCATLELRIDVLAAAWKLATQSVHATGAQEAGDTGAIVLSSAADGPLFPPMQLIAPPTSWWRGNGHISTVRREERRRRRRLMRPILRLALAAIKRFGPAAYFVRNVGCTSPTLFDSENAIAHVSGEVQRRSSTA